MLRNDMLYLIIMNMRSYYAIVDWFSEVKSSLLLNDGFSQPRKETWPNFKFYNLSDFFKS